MFCWPGYVRDQSATYVKRAENGSILSSQVPQTTGSNSSSIVFSVTHSPVGIVIVSKKKYPLERRPQKKKNLYNIVREVARTYVRLLSKNPPDGTVTKSHNPPRKTTWVEKPQPDNYFPRRTRSNASNQKFMLTLRIRNNPPCCALDGLDATPLPPPPSH